MGKRLSGDPKERRKQQAQAQQAKAKPQPAQTSAVPKDDKRR